VKLIRYAEEIMGEFQGDFQRRRSTFGQIFTMKQILEKCWEQNIVGYIYLLILNQHMTLYGERKYGVKCLNWASQNRKVVNLCRILNNEIYSKVKIGKHLLFKFKVNSGLRQKDAIAPLLFNEVLGIAVRRSKAETWGPLFDKCSHVMAYAMVSLLWEEQCRV
jgi:hypothetical protein